LNIAAYIHVEDDKERSYSFYEGNYTYISGFYYICAQQLKYFEVMEINNYIKAYDIIPINAYNDDISYFYLHDRCVRIHDISQFKNKLEEEYSFYLENIFLDDEMEIFVDSISVAEMKNNIVTASDVASDDDNSNDINFLASPCYGIYYFANRKDLIVCHDDLMQFIENKPTFVIDNTDLVNSNIEKYQININSKVNTNSENGLKNLDSSNDYSERMYYLLIVRALLKIIMGEYSNIGKHPILKGRKAESYLIEELSEWNYRGLSKRNLQKIFSEAKKLNNPVLSENSLLIAIGAMMDIILGTYPKGEKHPSIASESDLLSILPRLEQDLREIDSQPIFAKAKTIISNA